MMVKTIINYITATVFEINMLEKELYIFIDLKQKF